MSSFGRMLEEDRSNRTSPFQTHWLPHNTSETDGLKQGEGRRFQSCYWRVITPCDLWPFLHFKPNGGSIHWLADAEHPFGIVHSVVETARLKPIR